MKRKILLIIGKSDLFLPDEYSFKTDKLIENLKTREDIDLEIVGSDDTKNFYLDTLDKAINKLDSKQPLTVIVLSHGTYDLDKGFRFILDNKLKLSSKELFTKIGNKLQETPVDVFTTACHGGGILEDKDCLPIKSTLVALTTKHEINNSSDFDDMQKIMDEFEDDFSAYNLLQFYLSKCLKNRFYPQIGITGGSDYNLNELLEYYMKKPIELDISHFKKYGTMPKYREVLKKILMHDSVYEINAVEYGTALSIILNDFKNKGNLTKLNKETDTLDDKSEKYLELLETKKYTLAQLREIEAALRKNKISKEEDEPEEFPVSLRKSKFNR